MSARLQGVLHALDEKGCKSTRCGSGWSALCPSHEADGEHHDPSLSITLGEDGRVLAKCFAGCTFETIVRALDLTAADFAPERPSAPTNGRATTARSVVATYDYTDEKGDTLFQVVRYDPKGFKQRRPDPARPGNWLPNLNGVRRVLFHLKMVTEALKRGDVIYFVEGEKDALAIESAVAVATTNPCGASGWRPEFAEALRGAREVVIVADRDLPGYRHAARVADALRSLVGEVRIVEALKGKDASDHLAAGHRLDELVPIDLNERIKGLSGAGRDERSGSRMRVRRMSDVTIEPIDWLWPERIARGSLSLIVGDPDLGKSTITFELAARVTRGSSFPDGASNVAGIGSVVILSMENSPAQVIAPRLKAAGADLLRVHLLDGIDESTATRPGFVRSVSLESDLADLDEVIDRIGDVQLLIVDPLQGYMGEADSHVDAQVRQVLGPLAALAERHRIAVVAVMHTNKRREGPALYRVGGSIGFVAAARAVFVVVKDGSDSSRRLFVSSKNNLSADRTGLAYRLAVTPVEGLPKPVPYVEWEPGKIDADADQVLSDAQRSEDSSALAEAEEWLSSELADGPIPAIQVRKDAKANGIADRTLERAKREMRVRSMKVSGDASWRWTLPADGKDADQAEQERQECDLA